MHLVITTGGVWGNSRRQSFECLQAAKENTSGQFIATSTEQAHECGLRLVLVLVHKTWPSIFWCKRGLLK
jgi:hypothetical protein